MSYKIQVTPFNEILVEGTPFGKDIRIGIEKGGNNYHYMMNSAREYLPTQFGNGTYTVKMMQRSSGNKFKVNSRQNFNIVHKNPALDPYLCHAQPIYWKDSQLVISLAKQVSAGAITPQDKVEKIYKHVMIMMEYDTNKIKHLTTEYVPNLEEIIRIQSGLCYDYAALLAGLLRSVGIPAKLIKGYCKHMKEYHAWNEVWLNGRWVVIDATYDDALNNSKRTLPMIKSVSYYTKEKEY